MEGFGGLRAVGLGGATQGGSALDPVDPSLPSKAQVLAALHTPSICWEGGGNRTRARRHTWGLKNMVSSCRVMLKSAPTGKLLLCISKQGTDDLSPPSQPLTTPAPSSCAPRGAPTCAIASAVVSCQHRQHSVMSAPQVRPSAPFCHPRQSPHLPPLRQKYTYPPHQHLAAVVGPYAHMPAP